MPMGYLCSYCYNTGLQTIARRESINSSSVSSSFFKIPYRPGPKSSKSKSPLKYKPGPKSFKLKSQRPGPISYKLQLQLSQTPGRRSSQVTSPLPHKAGSKSYNFNLMLNRPMPKSKKRALLSQLNEINTNSIIGGNVNKLCIMLNRPMPKSKKDALLHEFNEMSINSQIVDNMNRDDESYASIDLSTRNYEREISGDDLTNKQTIDSIVTYTQTQESNIESVQSIMMSEELYTPNQDSNVSSSDVSELTVPESPGINLNDDDSQMNDIMSNNQSSIIVDQNLSGMPIIPLRVHNVEIFTESDGEIVPETDDEYAPETDLPVETVAETYIPTEVVAETEIPVGVIARADVPEEVRTERNIPDEIIAETYVREEIVTTTPGPNSNGPEWEPDDLEPISTLAPLRVNSKYCIILNS